ncbi:MAG TPA: acetyl-CoA carboxylase biotin carboxyl carrier protein [Steroidobacteraceae bacterium]|nr:acetyl-CoA carboxylase biotin carboxyl carrier protein [Steroidobacteraceae bacterium]
MSLTAQDVELITRLLKDSAFDELELEIDGLKLMLRREAGPPPVTARAGGVVAAAPAVPAVPAATAPAAQMAPAARTAPATATPPGTLVTAPLLGTFYRAPRPGAEPFVKEGSAVEPDTVIGIIEVMKLMNAVHAGMHGHVSEILVQDGALVEYAQPLLRVSPR